MGIVETTYKRLYETIVTNVVFGCAPCKGGVSQWVRIPPGNFAQPEAIGAVMEGRAKT